MLICFYIFTFTLHIFRMSHIILYLFTNLYSFKQVLQFWILLQIFSQFVTNTQTFCYFVTFYVFSTSFAQKFRFLKFHTLSRFTQFYICSNNLFSAMSQSRQGSSYRRASVWLSVTSTRHLICKMNSWGGISVTRLPLKKIMWGNLVWQWNI